MWQESGGRSSDLTLPPSTPQLGVPLLKPHRSGERGAGRCGPYSSAPGAESWLEEGKGKGLEGLMEDAWPPAPLRHLGQDLPHPLTCPPNQAGRASWAPLVPALLLSSHCLFLPTPLPGGSTKAAAPVMLTQTVSNMHLLIRLNFENKDPAFKKRHCVAISESLLGFFCNFICLFFGRATRHAGS